MRKLFILRGAACSGKTSFIEANRLAPYTISLEFVYPVKREMDACGRWVSRPVAKKDREVLVAQILNRMSRGETIFIDGRNLKVKDLNFYRQLADDNRYEMAVIEFRSDVNILLKRNSKKPDWGKLTKKELTEQVELMDSEVIPEEIPVITKHKLPKFAELNDFNQYDEIVHIGDIHGCLYPLFDALGCDENGKGLKSNTAYVFTGDLLERGPENAETYKFFERISGEPNVYMIEGNHDTKLWDWAVGNEVKTNEEFERMTSELESAGVTTRSIKKLCKKMLPYLFYTFNGNKYFCTHGGVPRIPEEILCMPAGQLIGGVGQYAAAPFIDEMFEKIYSGKGIYQIHGHRNPEYQPIKVNDCCFNLDGHVEDYGALRRLTINRQGIECKSFDAEG